MSEVSKQNSVAKNLVIKLLILCALGIGINVGLSWLASFLGLPLYLDSVGTVIVAFLGGALPGIAVGLITNFIKSINDYNSVFYGTLNVMIAVVTAAFTRHGYKKRDIVILVPVLALIGGGLGSILTWFLFGFGNEGVTASLARTVHDSWHISNRFLAQFIADYLIDLADKAVTVGIAVIVVAIIPKRFIAPLRQFGWRQRPLNKQEMKDVTKMKVRQISLRGKILLLLSVAIAIIALAAVTVGYMVFQSSVVDDHSRFGRAITENLACYINPNRINTYLEEGEEAEGYKETKKALQQMKNSYPEIMYIYVYQIREDGCHVVFDLDSGDVPGSEVGTVVPFDESFMDVKDDLIHGRRIEPRVTNDTYGWLLTAYKPMYAGNGECSCYIGVDISMEKLVSGFYQYLAQQISLFLGFFILVLAVALWLADYGIIYPLNAMAHAASGFAFNSTQERNESVQRLKNLQIRTGDEIEHLYDAYTQTTSDTMKFLTDSRKKGKQIDKLQTGLILVLADMVESRDKNTGYHIKKTASYTEVILKQLQFKGEFKDIITKKYISDVAKAAPLHDIGKISVPDAILNKPGRLEPDEFEIMKNHTTAGYDIINRAISTVSESGYLEEAKDLARSHHEKYDGSGYPQGLKGEEIPLSARVMAVADVFDALVSKRSYKEPMTYDEAFEFIQNGAGKHFDPKCVEAFVEMRKEVEEIAESFKET